MILRVRQYRKNPRHLGLRSMALMPKLKLLISFIYEGGPMRRSLTAFIIAVVMIGVPVLFGQNIIETGKTTEQSTELGKRLKELGNQINESTNQPKIINVQSDDSTDQTQVLIWAFRNYWPQIQKRLLRATSITHSRSPKSGINRRTYRRLRPASARA